MNVITGALAVNDNSGLASLVATKPLVTTKQYQGLGIK